MSDSLHTLIDDDSFVPFGNLPCDILSQIVLLASVVFFDTSAMRNSLISEFTCDPIVMIEHNWRLIGYHDRRIKKIYMFLLMELFKII